jgi:glycogen debranching enzyme
MKRAFMSREDLTTIASHVFIVTDTSGDIQQSESRGLFAADTRFLSRYVLLLGGSAPELLRSGSVGFNRADVYATHAGDGAVPRNSIGLRRQRTLSDSFVEQIELRNHGLEAVEIELSLEIDVDFADIFEVRGFLVEALPERAEGLVEAGQVVFSSRSLEFHRQTLIRFSRSPSTIDPHLVTFAVPLEANSSWSVGVTVEWVSPRTETALPIPVHAIQEEQSIATWLREAPVLKSSDFSLQTAFERSIRDLAMLELVLSSGHAIPAAGVPWYLAIFGRDAIITSLQTLPIAPRYATGTLRTLAAYQATLSDAYRDAEPGKMPHEIRFGSLAQSDAVPHSRYYGTVDATPLWLILLAAAHRWIDDRALIEELLPAARRALRWIEEFGDSDGDGFVEYQTRSSKGLVNQGWKDSWDGIRFADGRIAEPPIALVEVQGYVYAAKRGMAVVFESLGLHEEAASLLAEAKMLKERVLEAFWMPNEGCFAIALDGHKQQVDSIASNQGHLLWAGLPDAERARSVADRLMQPDCFSGWGIRTMASSTGGFNPFGYHTGSVWPHDTALIAAGFRRYGFDEYAVTLTNALIDASKWFEDFRLPELFCGYARADTSFPVDYPVACSPQAWAAGAMVMLTTGLVGLEGGTPDSWSAPRSTERTLRLSGVSFRGARYDFVVDGNRSSSHIRMP